MAFVFRSAKEDKIPKKEGLNNSIKQKLEILRDSIIFNSSTFNENKSQKIKAPFGVLSKKCDLPNLKSLNSPGPGAYDINTQFIKKHFNKNNTSPDIAENIDENKKRQFITQENRFNKNQYETDVPGPGKYFKDNKKKYYNTHQNNLSKQVFLYNQEINNYEPFSTSRILSIPPKGNSFGYEIYKDGEIKLIEDPNKDIKFSGNKNNSVGPGQYDSFYNQKNTKIGIIDWNKSIHNSLNKKKEKENEKKKGKKKGKNLETEIIKNSQINSSHYDSNYFLSNISTEPTNNSSLSIINFNKKNRTKNYFYTNIGFDRNNIEVKFSNNKIYKNENFTRTINNNNISTFFKFEQKPEIDLQNEKSNITPGPGAYLSSNKFNFIQKDEKYQFFGSTTSRGIIYPSMINNKKMGKITLENLLDIDNITLSNNKLNKSKSFNSNKNDKTKKIKVKGNKNKKNNNNIQKIDKIELIKELSKKIKKDLEKNVGPGSYNPNKISKNTNNSEVGSFGSLERRFPIFPSKDEFPGVGAYFHLETWGPKKKSNSLDKIIPPNISQKLKEGISYNKISLFRDKIMKENHKKPIIGQYSIENINTIETNTKKSISVSKNQPGFGSSFKRFYIFQNQINENNGVGNYNLKYPDALIYQRNAAFLGSAGRKDIDNIKKKNILNPIVGPGYYKNDSYFDWNTKSYNILFN